MNWDQTSFNTRLTATLSKRDLTKKSLSDQLKVSPVTVTRWGSSRDNKPSLDMICAIAEKLDVTPSWLAFGHDDATMDDEEFELIEDWRKMPDAERHAFSALCHTIVQDRSAVLKPAGKRSRSLSGAAPATQPALSPLPPVVDPELALAAGEANVLVSLIDPTSTAVVAAKALATRLGRLVALQSSQLPTPSTANASRSAAGGVSPVGKTGSPP